MVLITILTIALSLSADCFAIAVTSGAVLRKFKLTKASIIAGFFSCFQGIMPLVGFAAGAGLKGVVADYDRWAACALLIIIGGKMVYESLKSEEESRFDPARLSVIFMLSFATSIDAFAVGITLSLIAIPIWASAAIIAAVTFAVTFTGVYIGAKICQFFERRLETAGGIVLILLGLKILLVNG